MKEKNKDIMPINNKGKSHGYQQWYHNTDNSLKIRVVYKNGVEIGYEEWHNLLETNFYIK